MVAVRLFAHLREIAGTGRFEVEATDVRGVLAAVRERFGPSFAEGLTGVAVWVDGEPLDDPAQPLSPSSEVALVPPVSGGARAQEPRAG